MNIRLLIFKLLLFGYVLESQHAFFKLWIMEDRQPSGTGKVRGFRRALHVMKHHSRALNFALCYGGLQRPPWISSCTSCSRRHCEEMGCVTPKSGENKAHMWYDISFPQESKMFWCLEMRFKLVLKTVKIGPALLEIKFLSAGAHSVCTMYQETISSLPLHVPSVFDSVCGPDSMLWQRMHKTQRVGVKWASAKPGVNTANKIGQDLGGGEKKWFSF